MTDARRRAIGRWAIVPVAAAALIGTGCSRSDPPSNDGERQTVQAADAPERSRAARSQLPRHDPRKQAPIDARTAVKPAVAPATPQAERVPLTSPQDWREYLVWAAKALQETNEPVPLPDTPALASPAKTVLRLDELLAGASVRCDWKAPSTDAKPLFVKPGGSLKIPKNLPRPPSAEGDEPDGFVFAIRDLNLQREDIGRISFEARIPFGDHVDLIWSEDGRIRLPIPDNEKSWPVSVTTDGFADWVGPLTSLQFKTAAGDGTVRIKSVEFWGHATAFPEPVAVRPVTIQRQRRTALYTHCPAEVRLADVTIPPDGRFHAGLGHIIPRHSFSGDKRRGHTTAADTESTTVGRARFEVVLDVGGESRTVIDQQVSPAEGWIDVHATLAEWAGLTATIILRTSSDSPDAIALWASPTIFQPDASAPFVVIYLIDALSALHLDLYGYTRPTMPALRRLAEGGTWLANMFSNSSRTIESIPDLMLSLPAELHGVISPSIAAPPALVTIADAFRAAGYATASFCTNVNAGPQQNMDQGFDVFVDRIDSWRDGSANRTVPLENVQLWMAANRDRPMFAYIHTAEPHAPYTPINGFAGRFSSAHPGEIDGTYDEKTGFRSATTQEQRDRVMALYDDEVAYADSRLGEFLAAVDAAGLRERLTILVIADHGEEFQQHGGWEHGTNLHTEQTRIPLVVHSPLFPPRGRIDTAAQMVDLMPTLLDLFGLPQPYPLAGRSLRPLLHPDGDDDAAQQLAQRTLYLSNFRYKVFGWVEFALIEAGRWKLILRSNEHGYKSGGELTRFALFDIQADPGETRNLLDEQRDLARRLIDQLVAYARSQRPFSAGPAQPIQYDTKQIRELQSLGYVGQE